MNLEKWLEDREDWRPFVDLILVPPNRVEVLQEFPDADITGFWNTDDEPIFTTFGFSRAAAYVKLRRTGSTDRFAHMVAVQSAPRIKTDSTFFEGGKRLADHYSPQYVDHITKVAKRHGYTPNSADQYFDSLARFPGDPEAFVPHSGGRGYIRKLCERRGLACSGAVNVAGREPETDPFEKAAPLAPDLIRENARRFVQQNPDQARKMSKVDLVDHVKSTHGQT